jgi:hypothetical protein
VKESSGFATKKKKDGRDALLLASFVQPPLPAVSSLLLDLVWFS